MKEIQFRARSPYEIGDVLITDNGERKIKEIVCLNYASNGKSEFRYQFEGADEKFYKLPDPMPISGDLGGLN